MPAKRFSVLSAEGLALVRQLVNSQQDPTLIELCERVLVERGVEVGIHQMCRALRRLGLSRIKRGRRPKDRISVAA
jgi:transposase